MKQVVIVNAGGWGSLSAEKGDYDEFVGYLQRILDAAEEKVRERLEKAAEVHVVRSVKEALDILDGHGVLVFMTRGMLGEARRIKARYEKMVVVVLTGLIPSDEVIILSKGWDLAMNQLQRAILDIIPAS